MNDDQRIAANDLQKTTLRACELAEEARGFKAERDRLTRIYRELYDAFLAVQKERNDLRKGANASVADLLVALEECKELKQQLAEQADAKPKKESKRYTYYVCLQCNKTFAGGEGKPPASCFRCGGPVHTEGCATLEDGGNLCSCGGMVKWRDSADDNSLETRKLKIDDNYFDNKTIFSGRQYPQPKTKPKTEKDLYYTCLQCYKESPFPIEHEDEPPVVCPLCSGPVHIESCATLVDPGNTCSCGGTLRWREIVHSRRIVHSRGVEKTLETCKAKSDVPNFGGTHYTDNIKLEQKCWVCGEWGLLRQVVAGLLTCANCNEQNVVEDRKEIKRLETDRAVLLEAMQQLAKLGNGDHYGNSDGNKIAQLAIARFEEASDE